MQKISIEEAAEGMVLAKPVLSEQGTTLCREGSELTEGMIDTLKRRGIARLKVKGRPIERSDEKPLEERISEVRHHFSKVEEEPVALKIRDTIIKHLKIEFGDDDES